MGGRRETDVLALLVELDSEMQKTHKTIMWW
jgi:hypothetical protein